MCRAETCVFVRLFFYFAWRCLTISAKEKENLLNEEITAKEVRLIGADGETLGIMSSEKALETAYDQGMDLVLMSGQANPPVCKIMDYGKFRFEKAKKEKEAKKNQKTIEIKEIRLSLNIDTHDFDTKINHARKFISSGNKVKVSIRFRGREMAHPELGLTIMNRCAEAMADCASVEKPAKLEGRQMLMFLAPKSSK